MITAKSYTTLENFKTIANKEVKRDIYLEKHINCELTWESVSNALLTITGSDFLVATMPALPREQKRKKKL